MDPTGAPKPLFKQNLELYTYIARPGSTFFKFFNTFEKQKLIESQCLDNSLSVTLVATLAFIKRDPSICNFKLCFKHKS